MKYWVLIVLKVILAALVLVTFIALVASDAWWIQVFDFPRLQFAAVLAATIIIIGFIGGPRRIYWCVAGLAALAFQIYQIYPYSALAATQAADAAHCTGGNRLRLMSVNVLQSNTQYEELITLVKQENPDILLVMENNQQWTDALGALDPEFPYQSLRPQDNYYGMALYSRYPMQNTEVRDLAGENTPSIRTRISMPSGKNITVYAVHPRPPHPGQGSGQRDAELILLAHDVKKTGRPAVIMGDFNDVGWSSAMELFQKVGGVLDARIGRTFGASYNAQNPLMRWPLDHVFHTNDFGVMRFETARDIGSDHFPILAELCQDENRFLPKQNAPELDAEARNSAVDQLRMGAGEDVQAEANRLAPEE